MKLSADQLLEDLITTYKLIKQQHANLCKDLSRTDQAISDLEHKIELTKFGLYDSYLITIKLKEYLTKRRIVKDELENVQFILSNLETNEFYKIKEKLKNRKNKLSIRKYTPRVLDLNTLQEMKS
ncbi:MAG: hypothetical protein K0S47_4446 [Herbinix sp.]|jgi:hypothetical protein|nr:hypothetical protein [Herbinix sp.]